MRLWPAVIYEWGSTVAEREGRLGCDRLLADPDHELFRAVDVDAPASTVFRWLCQLRVGPYSYDRLDNGGRRSPQTLTPGIEQLAVGQRVMSVFRLVDYEQDRWMTLSLRSRFFGLVTCTYRVDQPAPGLSRLLVKVLVSYPRPWGLPMRAILPPGDLVMMRRQLLNLKALAEAHAS
jgi:hypothetical protein